MLQRVLFAALKKVLSPLIRRRKIKNAPIHVTRKTWCVLLQPSPLVAAKFLFAHGIAHGYRTKPSRNALLPRISCKRLRVANIRHRALSAIAPRTGATTNRIDGVRRTAKCAAVIKRHTDKGLGFADPPSRQQSLRPLSITRNTEAFYNIGCPQGIRHTELYLHLGGGLLSGAIGTA